MSSNISFLKEKLLKHTSFFGVRLWILIFMAIVLLIVVILIFLSLFFIFRRGRKSYKSNCCLPLNPIASKNYFNYHNPYSISSSLDWRLLPRNSAEIELNNISNIGKPDHQGISSTVVDLESVARYSPVVPEMWRGRRFSLKEIEVVTNGFADENLIGNGDCGVVYRGVLLDTTRVAVKRLLSDSCQAEDFKRRVEAIMNVRHKNLVNLLGHCMEGAYRILVYECIDNGNLHQWLHGCIGQVRPLTWRIRMNIIHGIAKGLAYLHEDIEPKIVHQDIKSSNILLDQQWNPKISDVGLIKLLGPECSHIATYGMVMSGYVAQEYDSPGVLNEKSDVYSFGILIMEIISGRTPVDHSQLQVYLIDWLKSMVANKKILHVLDPKLPENPSTKELKRIILIALRCVDPDIKHRPKMGDVIHMLEPRDLLLNDERRIRREPSPCRNHPQENQTSSNSRELALRTDELESTCNPYQKITPR